MPFYEYECPHCGYHDEVCRRSRTSPDEVPELRQEGLKKLMSAPLFRLKGSGWYETDFKSDKENKRNLAGADKEEAKSESKSEAQDRDQSEAKAEAPSRKANRLDKPAPRRSKRPAAAPRPSQRARARPSVHRAMI
jgi:putative FmdB family regulatory protein